MNSEFPAINSFKAALPLTPSELEKELPEVEAKIKRGLPLGERELLISLLASLVTSQTRQEQGYSRGSINSL